MDEKQMIERLQQCEVDLLDTDEDTTVFALRMVRAAIRDLESGEPDRVNYAADFFAAVTSDDPDDIPRFLERGTKQ